MRAGAGAEHLEQDAPTSRQALRPPPPGQGPGGHSRAMRTEHYEYEEEVDLLTGEVRELPCHEDKMRTSQPQGDRGAETLSL